MIKVLALLVSAPSHNASHCVPIGDGHDLLA